MELSSEIALEQNLREGLERDFYFFFSAFKFAVQL